MSVNVTAKQEKLEENRQRVGQRIEKLAFSWSALLITVLVMESFILAPMFLLGIVGSNLELLPVIFVVAGKFFCQPSFAPVSRPTAVLFEPFGVTSSCNNSINSPPRFGPKLSLDFRSSACRMPRV